MRTGSILFFAIVLLSTLSLLHGYQLGCNDQVELLPYAYFLKYPNYYAQDFFIQGLHAAQPNERTVMAHLLIPFIDEIVWWNAVFHISTSLLLFTALICMAELLIGNLIFAFVAVALSLLQLYDYGIGHNEVWTAAFQASNLSASILAWSFFFFIKRNFSLAFVVLTIASIIHPLEGLTAFAGIAVYSFWRWWKHKKIFVEEFVAWLFYMFTAGLLMFLLYFAKSKESSPLSEKELFDILFLFRHPQHFIFSFFPVKKITVTFLGAVAALLLFKKRHPQLAFWVGFSTLGILVYAYFTDVWNSVEVANFQFYRAAQWIKFFGVVAVVYLISQMGKLYFSKKLREYMAASFIALLLLWVTKDFFSGKRNFKDALCGCDKDMVDICRKIETTTPINAVFIHPFETTELKWYGKRSSYVEFKANVRHKMFVPEWYNRINQVYGISVQDKEKGFDLQQKANRHFRNLNYQQLHELKQRGVTHLLTFSPVRLPECSLIMKNHTYAVYQL
jgi:hypothetical protein